MTVSNGKSAREILWEVYGAGAKSMEDGGGSDQEVNEALAALEEIMVAAKPGKASAQIWHETPSDAWEMGIDQYEQNIRQAFSNGGGE